MLEEQTYVGPARNFTELCAAFRLVQKRYEELGYAHSTLSGMRFSALNLFSTTTTFVSVFQERVVGTATLILDSPAGLPLQSTFGAEYACLQGTGNVCGEGSMFAFDASVDRTEVGNLMFLMSTIFRFCIDSGVNDLYVVVNPIHVNFYCRLIGFQIEGASRSCAYVREHPGILLRKSLRSMCKADVTSSMHRMIARCAPIERSTLYRLGRRDTEILLRAEPSVCSQYLQLIRKLRADSRQRSVTSPQCLGKDAYGLEM